MFDSSKKVHCVLSDCTKGTVLPLVHTAPPSFPLHQLIRLPMPDCGTELRAGTQLITTEGAPLLRVVGRSLLAIPGQEHAQLCPLLEACQDIPHGAVQLLPRRDGWALAWITLSDKGASGLRTDESGPTMASQIAQVLPLCQSLGFLIPDSPSQLKALVMELAHGQGYDLIVTSGGTGLSPRDTTPEALLPLFDRRLPGFEQAMMQASLAKTPTAALSRAVAGTIGETIVVTLPGSRKAVQENLAAILPALGHALDKLHGDSRDCGR